MATLRQLAELIPAEYRKEILELDLIENAVATSTDQHMHYLAVIWKNYIEKDMELDCNLCYGRVLKNFRAMKNELIKIEQEANMLNTLS